MELTHGDAIDSLCRPCRSKGRRREAVDWSTGTDGRRYYVCTECAKELTRFGRDIEDLPETPHGQPCQGCSKMTLTEDLHPGSKRCPTCEGPEAVIHTVVDETEGMDPADALTVLDQLVEDEESVAPEMAAEAVERLTGVETVPASETNTEGVTEMSEEELAEVEKEAEEGEETATEES